MEPTKISQEALHSLMQVYGDGGSASQSDMHHAMTYGPQLGLGTPQAPADPTGAQAYAKQRVEQQYGNDPTQWNALYQLVNNESGWNSQAQNPTSSAYGLGQLLDSTWAGTGYQKTSDPNAQVDALLKYIGNRYGSPAEALNFWQNVSPTKSAGGGNHWY